MIKIETLPTLDLWAEAAAQRLVETLDVALKTRDQVLFAGSGGSTPSPIYAKMQGADIDWSRVNVTLVDERHVPETHKDSNATLLKNDLLQDRAASARFIPLYSPAVTVDRAASEASKALAQVGGHIDAALLGMGEDGHICSIFPFSPTLKTLLTPSLKPAVYGVPVGRDGLAPSLERLSINLPYLIEADRVVLALKGRTKLDVFEREAAGDPAIQPIAALIAAGVKLDVLWTEGA